MVIQHNIGGPYEFRIFADEQLQKIHICGLVVDANRVIGIDGRCRPMAVIKTFCEPVFGEFPMSRKAIFPAG